ncbi:MAG: hypothetical protein ACYDHW_06610 [Syntrophorhabdaceae bacterium]
MNESVWIVYSITHERKVEYITRTENEALILAHRLKDRKPDRTGIDIQEWVLD